MFFFVVSVYIYSTVPLHALKAQLTRVLIESGGALPIAALLPIIIDYVTTGNTCMHVHTQQFTSDGMVAFLLTLSGLAFVVKNRFGYTNRRYR